MLNERADIEALRRYNCLLQRIDLKCSEHECTSNDFPRFEADSHDD